MDKTMSDEDFYKWVNYELVVHRSDKRTLRQPTLPQPTNKQGSSENGDKDTRRG